MSKPRIVAYDPKRKKFCILTENKELLIGKCGRIMTKEEFEDLEEWMIGNYWMIDHWYLNCDEIDEEDYLDEDLYEKDRFNWAMKRAKRERKLFYKNLHRYKEVVFVCDDGWDDSVPLLAPKKLEPLISIMKNRAKYIEEHKKTLESFPTYEQFYDYMKKKYT